MTTKEIESLGFTVVSTSNNYGMVSFDNTEPKSSKYETSDIKQIVDAWAKKLPDGIKEARLIKYEELTNN